MIIWDVQDESPGMITSESPRWDFRFIFCNCIFHKPAGSVEFELCKFHLLSRVDKTFVRYNLRPHRWRVSTQPNHQNECLLQGNQIRWRTDTFWKDKYCPKHIADGTIRCCACNRYQPQGSDWAQVSTEGSRHLCLDCVGSIVVDTQDAQPLYGEVGSTFTAACSVFWVPRRNSLTLPSCYMFVMTKLVTKKGSL